MTQSVFFILIACSYFIKVFILGPSFELILYIFSSWGAKIRSQGLHNLIVSLSLLETQQSSLSKARKDMSPIDSPEIEEGRVTKVIQERGQII